ncbi:MAG: methyltransferase domain-containing protein [Anaerolineae bacterium]|nr:methyltransferase domain-containing protein [Anaerolineae bacterium]
MTTADEQRLSAARHVWDQAAASFDEAADHGLRDPLVRAAWTRLLQELLPADRGTALDIGCGTGSLSVLLAESGYQVTGIDLSPAMIALAQAKAAAAGQTIKFEVMDAAFPPFDAQQFDLILCRHLLFMLPTPDQVLRHWVSLLKPRGRLLLIEGFWHTGAGLHSGEIVALLPDSLTQVAVRNLSEQADLWGADVSDERYAITATLGA